MSDIIFDTLPLPLGTIFVEMQPGDYKDFSSAGDYPLSGVTFASRYGYLPGFTGEDGVELDFFVGSQREGLCGSFTVFRPELKHGEHKFYVAMTKMELTTTLKEYGAVVLNHEPLENIGELLHAIEGFKD